ncbi:MAG: antibiotic biosynthesis monooxygenase family protein [Planctomycetota bacterium]
MTITRINEFHAREGEGEAFRALVESILPEIRAAEGCRSCQLLQRHDDASRLIVIEVWDSIEAHQAARHQIPSGNMIEAMKLLASPPSGQYYRA